MSKAEILFDIIKDYHEIARGSNLTAKTWLRHKNAFNERNFLNPTLARSLSLEISRKNIYNELRYRYNKNLKKSDLEFIRIILYREIIELARTINKLISITASTVKINQLIAIKDNIKNLVNEIQARYASAGVYFATVFDIINK